MIAVKFTETGGTIAIIQKKLNLLPSHLALWKRGDIHQQITTISSYHKAIQRLIEKSPKSSKSNRLILESTCLGEEKECREAMAWLQMSIQDTGIGITVDDLQSLFHPYGVLLYSLNDLRLIHIDTSKFVAENCKREEVQGWDFAFPSISLRFTMG